MGKCGTKWLQMGKNVLVLSSKYTQVLHMTSFVGDYTGKIDTKGRVVFPSALKKQMQGASVEKFVIKKDIFEKCLIIYTTEEWERQNTILREKLNPYNKEHNNFLREYYRGTVEVNLDSNNRILLPARLLEHAGIEKEIYFSGQDKKIEIWSKEIFEKQIQEPDDFASLAEKILGGE